MSRCHLCDGADLMALPYLYQFEGKEYHGRKCRSCGLIFVDPLPDAETIRRMYSEEYYRRDVHCGAAGHDYDYFRDSPRELYRSTLADLEKRLGRKGSLLEVGCAGGIFLETARDEGWDVSGTEVSPFAAEETARRLGVPVHLGEVEKLALPEASFDAVFLGDVLEHVRRPLDTLRAANRLLRREGLLVLRGPMNLNLFSSRIALRTFRYLGRTKRLRMPPYHLYEYTPRSLKSLFARAGFPRIEMIESTFHPREIHPRGGKMEQTFRLALQVPNYAVTRALGVFGERVTVFAAKGARLAFPASGTALVENSGRV